MDNDSSKVERYRISCTSVPVELLDRINSAEHFKQFGRVTRIIFRQKQQACIVEYATKNHALNAVQNGNVFKNQSFNIELVEPKPPPEIQIPPKVIKKVEKDPDWPNDSELQAELDALGEIVPHQHLFRNQDKEIDDDEVEEPQGSIVQRTAIKRGLKGPTVALPPPDRRMIKRSPTSPRGRKPVRSRFPEKNDIVVKKKIVKAPIKPKMKPKKQLDTTLANNLCVIIRGIGKTAEEQYRILDARDKLIRLYLGLEHLNVEESAKIVGTCPDMCPEKERLLREAQHQVSNYEQNYESEGGQRMDPTKAVKQYSRSSADQEMPLAHELRPVKVLQLTMTYLFYKIINLSEIPDVNLAEWFHFMWDRTRAIRKDITQQQLCCIGSVELVEQCARFHIHCAARLCGEDLSVFDPKINTENLTKCLQTLKYMYHDLAIHNIYCPNEAEFRGYIILLNLHDSNFMWEVKQLREEIRKSREVSFALKIFSAMDNNNHVNFFKLVRSTTYLNACLLLRYFTEIRLRTLDRMIVTYSPRTTPAQIPVHELTKSLAFEDNPATIAFVEYHGLRVNENQNVVLERKRFLQPESSFEIERAKNIVESKLIQSVSEVICGKQLPDISVLENYAPIQSFTENGTLKDSAISAELLTVLNEFDNKEKSKPTQLEQKTMLMKPAENIFKRSSINKTESILAVTEPATKIEPLFGNTTLKNQSIFGAKSAIEPIFGQKSNQDTLKSGQSDNIFKKPTVPSIFNAKTNIFEFSEDNEKSTASIIFKKPDINLFTKQDTLFKPAESKNTFSTQSIFKTDPTVAKSNIFGTSTQPNAFPITQPTELKSIIFGKPNPPIQSKNIFEVSKDVLDSKSSSGLFFPVAKVDETRSKNVDFFSDPRTKHMFGNFVEDKKLEEQRKIEQQAADESKRKAREEYERREKQRKEQERREQERRELERKEKERLEAQRRQEELERQRKHEEEVLRQQLLEQMREKQKLAELKRLEELKRLDELKRLEELAHQERKKEVQMLLNEMVLKVEEIVTKQRLDEIREKIRMWKVLEFGRKWYRRMLSRKLKRKAVEDLPIWLPKRSFIEEAQELFTPSQTLALENMKRYKFNYQYEEINTEINRTIQFEPCLKLLQKSIQKHESIIKNTIFWKIVFSLPSEIDCKYHTQRLRSVIDQSLSLNRANENIYVDSINVSGDILNICIEINEGSTNTSYKKEQSDFIFFGINSEDYLNEMKQRLPKVLPQCDTLVIVLRTTSKAVSAETLKNELELAKLLETNLIKRYFILGDVDYVDPELQNSIESGLKILAKYGKSGVPPLEMDLRDNVLNDNIGVDFADRLKATMNQNYGVCVTFQNINIVIDTFNEAIKKLIEIVNNGANTTIRIFPKEFKSMVSKPTYPMTYEYFPNYWNEPDFVQHCRKQLESLFLPKFSFEWPPNDIRTLEENLEIYTKQYVEAKDLDIVFLKVLSYTLDYFEQTEDDFGLQMMTFPVIDILQILLSHKIKHLQNGNFEPILVYNKSDLQKLQETPWWLESAQIRGNLVASGLNSSRLNESYEIEFLNYDDFNIDEKLNEMYQMEYDEELLEKNKKEIGKFKEVMDDLECAMNIQKQAMTKFTEILEREIKNS